MARSRREIRPPVDIWPGFVDALSTLLLVLIFVLVVFVLGQFFLNQLLQGKDTKLARLEQTIAQLTDQLDLEQGSAAELRLSVSQLTADLQAATADREEALGMLADVRSERDDFRDRIVLLEDEQALLTQTLNEMRTEAAKVDELQQELSRSVDLRERLNQELEQVRATVEADKATIEAQLAQLVQLRRDIDALEGVRHDLELEVAEMTALLQAAETAKTRSAEQMAQLSTALEAAQSRTSELETQVGELSQRVTAADTETRSLEEELSRLNALLAETREEQTASVAQADRLRSEVAALQTERRDLAGEIERLNQVLAAARGENDQREQRLAELSEQLQSARDERAERERRLQELAAEIERTRAGSESSAAEVRELQQARERLLAELGSERDNAAALESRLADAQDKTMLAQEELEQRDLRIAELLRSAGRTEEALATEQTLSREALIQVEILNRQVNALRVQLAALEQTLDLEREKIEEQQITIADLGSKLNLALASKVEELSRFRSEFFGRLRQVLGDRPDVRIVGDRFVFQSEVLFDSASADIEPYGQDELRKLAQSLKTIMDEIPSDLPWVLQVNGHTDRRPINTPEFASNWELSAARAISVAEYLVDQGIPAERIAVAGFAQFQPLDDRRDEIAYRRNRRIEIKLTER
jgi:chemotaxis protein MotB